MDFSISQAELVDAVFEGAFEEPLWSTFLDLVRAQSGADHATLILRPPARPLADALHLYSGALVMDGVRRVYSQYLSSLDLLSEQGLTEGRAYAFDELYPPKNPDYLDFYNEVIVTSGVDAARVVRVTERTGVSAWLTISRAGRDFGESQTRFLEWIAPLLRGSLRHYVALEQQRYTADVISHAMRSLYFSWMTLDRNGNILDLDPEAETVFDQSEVLFRGPNQRISARPSKLDRDILAAIGRLADDPQARPHAITLKTDPWLDMLLARAPKAKLNANPKAAVVAYLHGDSWRSSDRLTQLGELFGLTPSEARLTLALSRGASPLEAAAQLGLSIDTVRSYTKVIYSKTGARGLADLVRIVMRSVLAFAPDR